MLWAGLEQCVVITLGSAPTLPALRQLDIGFLRSFGTSLASLVGVGDHWKRGGSSRQGPQDSTPVRSGDDMMQPYGVVPHKYPAAFIRDVEADERTFIRGRLYENIPDETRV